MENRECPSHRSPAYFLLCIFPVVWRTTNSGKKYRTVHFHIVGGIIEKYPKITWIEVARLWLRPRSLFISFLRSLRLIPLSGWQCQHRLLLAHLASHLIKTNWLTDSCCWRGAERGGSFARERREREKQLFPSFAQYSLLRQVWIPRRPPQL